MSRKLLAKNMVFFYNIGEKVFIIRELFINVSDFHIDIFLKRRESLEFLDFYDVFSLYEKNILEGRTVSLVVLAFSI